MYTLGEIYAQIAPWLSMLHVPLTSGKVGNKKTKLGSTKACLANNMSYKQHTVRVQ